MQYKSVNKPNENGHLQLGALSMARVVIKL